MRKRICSSAVFIIVSFAENMQWGIVLFFVGGFTHPSFFFFFFCSFQLTNPKKVYKPYQELFAITHWVILGVLVGQSSGWDTCHVASGTVFRSWRVICKCSKSTLHKHLTGWNSHMADLPTSTKGSLIS